jgi:histidinol dehydrogenase
MALLNDRSMITCKANDPLILKVLENFEQTMSKGTEIPERVAAILQAVREQGDAALLEYTERFDRAKFSPSSIRVTDAELQAGLDSLRPEEVQHIQAAKTQIEDYHRHTIPKNWREKNGHGACVGERFYPIEAVGLYVPGGRVPLVSSVLMSAVLAKLAGNPRIVVVTPPLSDGSIAPGMLAALKLCGITEVYKVGGAQAIAALAYGTASIPRVDKIFGPGNAYVLEAKRQVFGQVGIDLLPGPSEVAIVADESANPEWVAADLLAQAEHGSGKERVMLLVSNEELLTRIDAAIARQIPQRNHREAIQKVMQERFMRVIYSQPKDAVKVLNAFAPEHLELQMDDVQAEYYLRYVTTAGAMLVGHHTPTVLGDFTAGPSHTLPTGGAGRFMSGMRVMDYFRRTSTVHYSRKQLQQAAPIVATFSRLEQLDAHGHSLAIRLEE